MLFVCYPKCSTCGKARAWLDAHNIEYTERDIKSEKPSRDELAEWHKKSELPLRRFFNTSGQLYRGMGLSSKLADMSEDEQLDLLATDGMPVKRPILVAGDKVLVGFREKDWEAALLG